MDVNRITATKATTPKGKINKRGKASAARIAQAMNSNTKKTKKK